jgi:DNA-binding transcriptional ArsR family regulator
MGVELPQVETATQAFLKALASETRQQIMQLFAGGVELTVGEVAARAGLRQSTASEHLALMRRGGLLVSTRDGKSVRYRVDSRRIGAQLDDLKAYLAGCCPAPEDRGSSSAHELHAVVGTAVASS